MEKEIIYLGSEGNTVKKEGKNNGRAYYVHTFLLNKESFKVFEFADDYGVFKIQSYLSSIDAETLTLFKGKFDIYVKEGKLNVVLTGIERVI